MAMFKLKANDGVDIPKYLAALDTETFVNKDEEFQTLRYFEIAFVQRNAPSRVAKYGREWTEPTWFKGTTYQEAWSALDSIGAMIGRGRVWVVGHNIAYDWRVLGLDSYIGQEGWDKPRLFNTRSPFLVYTKHGHVTYNFVSSTNLYKGSLRELAPDFGMVKLGEELDMDKLDSYPDELIVPYCHRDVEIVLEIMKKHSELVRDGDMGSFKPTIAGQAHNFWRHRFMPKDTMTVYDSHGLIGMERDAYRGGRCDIFFKGKFKDCYQVDVHSMYPWAMSAVPYPVEPLVNAPMFLGKERMLKEMDEGHHIIADCCLDLKRPVIGMRRGSRLIFPVGRVRTTIDSPEILYLLSHPDSGEIRKVFRYIPYREDEVGFKEYVQHWFDIKAKADPDSYIYRNAKLMMNSLYGKMGQRYFGDIEGVEVDKAINIVTAMDDLGQDAIDDEFGGCYYRVGEKLLYRPKRSDKFAWHSMPRIPAKVCSMARMRLQELMDIAGPKHYYNCDTDSLIVDSKGLENLENHGELGDGLGKLGKVGPGSGVINAPKDYIFGAAVKRKGIKKNAVEIAPRVFQQDQFVTGLMSYKNGDRFGVRVTQVTKHLDSEYTKGVVTASGWVEPLVLREW